MNGEIKLCISGDDAALKGDAQRRVFGASPSKYLDLYEAELKKKVEKLVKYLEIENGIFGLQTIYNGRELVVLEMNYRLPGGKVPGEKYICDVMLDYALGENTNPIYVPMQNQMFSYAIWLKPGKIAEIQGVDVLQSRGNEFSVQLFRHVGEDIQVDTGMRQVLGFIMFFTDKEHHEEYIDFINENVKVLDENGNDIVCHYRFENGYAVA